MRRLVALALLLCSAALAQAAPCQFVIKKHERRTTTAQKRYVFVKAGVPHDSQHRPLYVVDHIVSLELGGTDTVDNMQLQTKAEGHAKDLIENFLAGCVCRGETPLAVAQRAVVGWKQVTAGSCPRQ